MPRVKILAAGMIAIAAAYAAAGAETPAEPGKSDAGRLFVLANEDYRKAFNATTPEEHRELLEAAVAGYRAALAAKDSSAAWHNLGNALFRLGRKGESIAAYRRAVALGGEVPDTTANLGFVRSACKGTPEAPVPGALARAVFFWYYGASMRFLEGAWAALWLAAWGMVFMWLWRRKKAWGGAAGVLLALALLCGGAYMQRLGEWRNPRIAVALEETRALSEARPTATALFTLGEGSEVRKGRRRGEWQEVLLPGGRRGWVAEEDLAL